VPIIASGGFAAAPELKQARDLGISGVAIADALHWKRTTLPELKAAAHALGVEVRL
jgi:cyclase